MIPYDAPAVRIVQGVGAGDYIRTDAGNLCHDYEVAEGLRLDYEETLVAVGVDCTERTAYFVLYVFLEAYGSGAAAVWVGRADRHYFLNA